LAKSGNLEIPKGFLGLKGICKKESLIGGIRFGKFYLIINFWGLKQKGWFTQG